MGDLVRLPERVGKVANLRAALRWTQETRAVVLGVVDDGRGLSPEKVARRRRSLSELEDYEMDLDERLTAALRGET